MLSTKDFQQTDGVGKSGMEQTKRFTTSHDKLSFCSAPQTNEKAENVLGFETTSSITNQDERTTQACFWMSSNPGLCF
jgi:hypothetical protein